eukprot:gene9925-2246_t
MEEKVDEQLKALEKTFVKDFGKEVSIFMDWTGSNISNKDTKYKLIEPSVKKGIFGDRSSLLKWLQPSKRAMEIFLEKVSNIAIVVTTDFTQPNKIGNGYYYVEIDGAMNALKVTINDGYINHCDGWGLKVDYLFDLNVKDEVFQRDCLEVIKKQQNDFNSTFISNIEFNVNWDFLKESTFKSKDESARKKIINELGTIYKKGIKEHRDSLLKWTSSSTRAQNAIKEKVQKITLQYIEKVNSKVGCKYYELEFDNKNILISIDISYFTHTDGFGLKVDTLLDLNVKDEEFIKETTKKLKEQEDFLNTKFSSANQSNIQFDVDWDFVGEQSFKNKDESARKKIILGIADIAKKGVSTREPLTKLTESQRALDTFLNRVKRIVLSYVENMDRNEGYFSITHDGSTLYVTTDISYYSHTKGWFEKTEKVLDLNLLDEIFMREAEKKNLDLEKTLSEHVETIIDVDWDSLVSTDEFKKQEESNRKKLINSTTTVIKKGITDSKTGLITHLKLSVRFQQYFNHFIKKILISFKESLPKSKIGNSYYEIERQGSTLLLTVKQSYAEHTDGWSFKIDKVLDMNVKDEVAMKENQKKIVEYENQLEQIVGKKINLIVDWSFVDEKTFKEKDETTRSRWIAGMVTIIKKGMFDRNGFKDLLSKNENLKNSISNNLSQIVIKVSDSIKSQEGSNKYSLEFIGGRLLVTVKESYYDSIDAWEKKIISILSDIENYSGDAPNQIPQHHYFSLPVYDQVIEKQTHLIHYYMKPFGGKSDEIVVDLTTIPPPSKHQYLEEVTAIKQEVNIVETSFTSSALFVAPETKEEPKKEEKPVIVPKQEATPKTQTAPPKKETAKPINKPAEKPVEVKTDKLSQQIEKTESKCENYFDELKKNLNVENVSIDWSFMQSNEFQQLNEKNQLSIVDKLQNFVKNIRGGLSKIWSDEVDLSEFKTLFDSIIFKKDSTDQIKTSRSSSFYDIYVEDKTIIFIENMSNSSQSYGQFADAMNSILNTSIKKAMNSANKKAQTSQKDISKYLEKEISVCFLWDFAENENFKKLDQKKQMDIIASLEKKHVSSLQSCLKTMFSDSIDKETFQGIPNYAITFDANNSIQNSYFSVSLNSSVFVLTINMDKYNENLAAGQFYTKVEEVFQNTLPKSKRETNKKIVGYEENMEKYLSFHLKLEVDWDNFSDHENYKKLDVKTKVELGNKLKDSYLYNIQRFIAAFGGDDVERDFMKQFQKVVFTFDPTNQIGNIPSCSIENDTIKFIANINQYSTQFNNIAAVCDPIFKLRVPKGIRDTNLKLVQYETKLYEAFTKIPIEINWDFTKHDNFLSLPLDKHSDVIKKIYDSHIYYITQGLQGFSSDTVTRESIKERIKKVNFTYDPEDKIVEPYSVFLKDGILYVVTNLNKYNTSISAFKDRMDPVLNLRVDLGKRDSVEKLSNSQGKIHSTFTKKIPLVIDWKFTESEEFLNRNLKDYTTIIAKLWEKIGYYGIQKLTGVYNDKKFNEKEFTQYVDEIVLSYDDTNSINTICHGEKNTDFRLTLIDRKLTYLVNLKNYSNICDNWTTRLYPILESIEAMGKFDSAKNLQSNLSISVDWESFINSSEYSMEESATRKNILLSFYELKLNTLQKVISKFNETEIGKNGFTERIDSILLSVDTMSKKGTPKVSYQNKTIQITFGLKVPTMEVDDLFLQMSKLIGIINPYHIDLANTKISKNHKLFLEAAGSKFDILVDWSYTETSKFNDLPPFEMRKIILETAETYFTFLDSLSDVYFGVQKMHFKPKPKDQYELIEVEDNTVNHNISCDKCRKKNFKGRRYKCLNCYDYDLCESCYKLNEHTAGHGFKKFGKQPIKRKIEALPVFREFYERKESKDYPGFIFLSKNLKKVIIGVDVDEKQSPIGNLKYNNGELKLILNTTQVINPFEAFWIERLQWAFDLIVPIADYDAKNLIQTLESSFTFTKIKITLDTAFAKEKKFLENEQHVQYNLTRLAFLDLIENVGKSLHKVGLHVMGESVVKEKITNVSFVIDTQNSQPKEGSISHSGNTLKVVVNSDDLSISTNADDWKARIELLFNLLVKITMYDNAPNVKRIEDEMESLLGKKLNLIVDTSFTENKEFKTKIPKDQTKIIYLLCTSISNQCVGKELMNICKMKSGKDAMSTLNQIIISTDHLNKQSNEGTISIQNSNLIINQNMNDIHSGKIPKDAFWKTQDLLGITNKFAQDFCFDSFSKIQQDFTKFMEKDIKFEIDYAFTENDEFKKLSTSVRNGIIQYINTTLLSDVFCVPEGLYGFIRLVKKEIHDAFEKIVICLDTKDSMTDPYHIGIHFNVLTALFPMREIISRLSPESSKLAPCRMMVEKILNLRPNKISSAFQQASNEVSYLQLKSNIKIPIEIDWDCLKNTKEFNETTKYVEMIDHVLSVVKKTIFGPRGGIPDAFPETIDALNRLKKINIYIDYSNEVKNLIGLYTPNYSVANISGILMIKSNYKYVQNIGCGMNAEFALTPSLAKLKQEQTTMRLQREEDERRRREEERKREEEKREREREQKKREELEKKRRERCTSCQNGYKRCNYCNGTGYASNIKSKCVYCGHTGSKKCTSCNGTGLKYPNL